MNLKHKDQGQQKQKEGRVVVMVENLYPILMISLYPSQTL